MLRSADLDALAMLVPLLARVGESPRRRGWMAVGDAENGNGAQLRPSAEMKDVAERLAVERSHGEKP